MQADHIRNVCRLYRELLILIKRLPRNEIERSWEEARSTIRRHKSEVDPMRASDLMKEMVAKISYLKTITPRMPGDGQRLRLGSGHWVMRDGKLVEGHGEIKGKRSIDLRFLERKMVWY